MEKIDWTNKDQLEKLLVEFKIEQKKAREEFSKLDCLIKEALNQGAQIDLRVINTFNQLKDNRRLANKAVSVVKRVLKTL